MIWSAPWAQLWHLEFLLLLALVVSLARRRDGCPKFEALMVWNLVLDGAQLWSVRTGHLPLNVNIAYVAYLGAVPLLGMALREAADYWTPHRSILFWWTAFTVGCLGVRFFPYTARVLLAGNCVAYVCWIATGRRMLP